ncbi:MAG: hypothetical protein HC821_05070 [Lewinella sp.]|nr:hypothetical protein [Lewinella sp.]
MKLFLRILLVGVMSIAFSGSSLLAGGPWPKGKGNAYLKLSEWWLRFDQHFTDQGELDPNQTSAIYNTTLYAEYGLTDRLSAVVNFPFFSRNTVNNQVSGTTGEILIPGEALNSVGDAELAMKYTFSAPVSKQAWALSLTLGLPTGNPKAGAEGNLQTGDGEFNQLLLLHTGRSFRSGQTYGFWAASWVRQPARKI